jgi:uncharacterized repeat protein (TIGR03803 family)
MSRARNVCLGTFAGIVLHYAAPAAATTFAVIGTVSGGPVIGAWRSAVIFGTTPTGGSAKDGTLFSLSNKGVYTLLHTFNGSTDGSSVNPQLGINASGTLYGTTNGGGQYGGGTLWEYATTPSFTVLHTFGASGDGANPKQGPYLSYGQVLYGATAGGAVSTNGMVFSYTSTGIYSDLHNFLSGTDGHCPFSGVTRAKNGTLYGTTVGNGFGGQPQGSVWSLSTKNVLTTLHAFADGTDGQYPDQAPTIDSTGNLYGTTYIQKGKNFPGAIWKISSTGAFSILHGFVAATDGFGPNSPLLLNKNGNLYGTTASQGPGGHGTLFQITPAGVFTVLHAFANGTDGEAPTGNLANDTSGYIYGGTASGQVYQVKP